MKLKLLTAITLLTMLCCTAEAQVNNGLFRAVKQLSSPQGKTSLSALFDNSAAADNLYSELKYSPDKNIDWSRVNYVDQITTEYTSAGKKHIAGALILQLPSGSQYRYIVIYSKSRNNGAGFRIVKSRVNWSNSDSIDSRALAAIRRSVDDIAQNW